MESVELKKHNKITKQELESIINDSKFYGKKILVILNENTNFYNENSQNHIVYCSLNTIYESLVNKYHLNRKITRDSTIYSHDIFQFLARKYIDEIFHKYYNSKNPLFLELIFSYCFNDNSEVKDFIFNIYETINDLFYSDEKISLYKKKFLSLTSFNKFNKVYFEICKKLIDQIYENINRIKEKQVRDKFINKLKPLFSVQQLKDLSKIKKENLFKITTKNSEDERCKKIIQEDYKKLYSLLYFDYQEFRNYDNLKQRRMIPFLLSIVKELNNKMKAFKLINAAFDNNDKKAILEILYENNYQKINIAIDNLFDYIFVPKSYKSSYIFDLNIDLIFNKKIIFYNNDLNKNESFNLIETVNEMVEFKKRKGVYKGISITSNNIESFNTYIRTLKKYEIPFNLIKCYPIKRDQIMVPIFNLLKLIEIINTQNIQKIELRKFLFVSVIKSYLFNYSNEKIHQLLQYNSYRHNEEFLKLSNLNYQFLNDSLSSCFMYIINEFNVFSKISKHECSIYFEIFKHIYNRIKEMEKLHFSFHDMNKYFDKIEKFNLNVVIKRKHKLDAIDLIFGSYKTVSNDNYVLWFQEKKSHLINTNYYCSKEDGFWFPLFNNSNNKLAPIVYLMNFLEKKE